MNEEMYNETLLVVMEELRNDPYFYKSNNLIIYEYPQDQEEFNGKKIVAILDLYKLGGIEVHNKGEERLTGNRYRFEILVLQPGFNGIFEQCLRKVRKIGLNEYIQEQDNETNLPLIKRKLIEIIKSRNIKGKEKMLLDILSDLQLHKISDLRNISESLSSMRVRINKKLKGSGFTIKSIRSKGWGSMGTGGYELVYMSTNIKS